MAIALGNQAVNTTSYSTTHTATLSVSAGDLLVACIARDDGVAISSVAGATNGAFTAAVNVGGRAAAIYYLIAGSTVTNEVFTVTTGEATTLSVNISRWSGAKASGVLDQVNSTTNASSTTGHDHGSITTTGAGLIVTSLGTYAGVAEVGHASFTALTNTGYRDYFQYWITSGAETTNGELVSVTPAAASDGAIASFLADSGGSIVPHAMAAYAQQ